MKKCSKCKMEKSKEYFVKDKNRKDGFYPTCKECYKEYRLEKVKNNPNLYKEAYQRFLQFDEETKLRYRRNGINNKLKHRYGISVEDYDEMFESQLGKCKICGRNNKGKYKNKRLSVDHDHSSGAVRGLLCYQCNTSLGWFENNKENVFNYLLDKNEEEF